MVRAWKPLLVLACVLCCAALAPALASAEETGSIAGTVTEAGSGDPIEGAEVCIWQLDGDAQACARADENGDYAIDGLPAGEYEVEFTGRTCFEDACTPGWTARFYDEVVPHAADPTPVLVAEGLTTDEIDARLEATGEIEGTISRAGGGAIANTMVCVNSTTQYYHDCAFTDAGGDYTIPFLPPGEFDIEFTGLVCDAGASGCEPEACEEREACSRAYIPQYYLEKAIPEPDILTLVQVSPGEAAEEIDATLSPGGKITGTVTVAALGKPPLAGIHVCASAEEGELRGECDFTDSSGRYTFEGLATGLFRVDFDGREPCEDEEGNCPEPYVTQYFDGKTDPAEANLIHLNAPATVTGIDASMVETAPRSPAFLTAPQLSGNASPGGTLSCSQGTWSNNPTSIAYAWLRNGAPIAGQASSSYAVTAADEGGSLSCAATVANPAGSATASSAALLVPVRPQETPPSDKKGKKGRASASLKASTKHSVTLTLKCPGKAACQGSLKLIYEQKSKNGKSGKPKVKKVTIGTASFKVAAGKSKAVAVKLTENGKRYLASAGKQGLKVKLTGSGVKARTLSV